MILEVVPYLNYHCKKPTEFDVPFSLAPPFVYPMACNLLEVTSKI